MVSKKNFLLSILIIVIVLLFSSASYAAKTPWYSPTYNAGGNIGRGYVWMGAYYGIANSNDAGQYYTIYMKGPGYYTASFASKKVVIEDKIPARTIRLYIFECYTGWDSRSYERNVLAYADFDMDTTINANTQPEATGTIAITGLGSIQGYSDPINIKGLIYRDTDHVFSGIKATGYSVSALTGKWVTYYLRTGGTYNDGARDGDYTHSYDDTVNITQGLNYNLNINFEDDMQDEEVYQQFNKDESTYPWYNVADGYEYSIQGPDANDVGTWHGNVCFEAGDIDEHPTTLSFDISGTLTWGYTLKVKKLKTNNTSGTKKYQWYRGTSKNFDNASAIANTSTNGAKSAEYKTNSDDCGKYLFCKVTIGASGSYTEQSLVVRTASKIGKRACKATVSMTNYKYHSTPSTPSVTVKDKSAGWIGLKDTVVAAANIGTTTYYYSTSNEEDATDYKWTKVTSATTPSTYLSAGTYYMYVKVKASSLYKASESNKKSFKVLKAEPTVTGFTKGDDVYHTAPSAASGYGLSCGCTMAASKWTITYGSDRNSPVGTYSCKVTFKGDGNHDSASKSQNYSVVKASPSVNVYISDWEYHGPAVTPTASLSCASNGCTGTYTFKYKGRGSTTYAETTTVPTAVGTYTCVAYYGGDSNHNSANGSKNFSITKRPVTVTASISDWTYHGSKASDKPSATLSCGCTATYTFKYKGRGSTTYNETTTVPTNAGTYTCVAYYAGDSNHKSANGSVNFTINKYTPTVTVSINDQYSYGETISPSASLGCRCTGTYTFKYKGRGTTKYVDANNTESTTAPTAVGTYVCTAYYGGDSNHNASSGYKNFEIIKATPKLEFTSTPSLSWVTDGAGTNLFQAHAQHSYGGNGSFNVKVSCPVNCAGTLAVSSNDTTYLSAKIGSATSESVTATSAGVTKTVSYSNPNSLAKKSAITITVSFTPSDTSKFNTPGNLTYLVGFYDHTAPTGSLSIRTSKTKLGGGKTENTRNVTLDIKGADGTGSASGTGSSLTKMFICNENSIPVTSIAAASWVNFVAEKAHTLTDGDGNKIVYVVLKDDWENKTVLPTTNT